MWPQKFGLSQYYHRDERGRKRNGMDYIKKEKKPERSFRKKTTNEKRQVVDKYAVNNDLK